MCAMLVGVCRVVCDTTDLKQITAAVIHFCKHLQLLWLKAKSDSFQLVGGVHGLVARYTVQKQRTAQSTLWVMTA